MKTFRIVMVFLTETLGAGMLGAAIGQAARGNYKISTILLFVVAALFIVGYFTEMFSKDRGK